MLRSILEYIGGLLVAFLFLAMFWVSFFFDNLDFLK